MNIVNRRTLIHTASTGALLLAVFARNKVVAAPLADDREFESELTGSVIALVDQDWFFNADSYAIVEETEYTKEFVSISNPRCTVEIEFVQTDISPEEYLALIQDDYIGSYRAIEIVDSGVTDAGAWFAAVAGFEGFLVSVYCEYQSGAYANADLVLVVNSELDDFVSNLDAVQSGILIGDAEPLVMLEASNALTMTLPGLDAAEPTESAVTRTPRGTTQSQTPTADSSYVDAVAAHREDFITSFAMFAEAIEVFGLETSTDADLQAATSSIDTVSLQWVDYPAQASSLLAPDEYINLGSLYVAWAEEIAKLGSAWQAIRNEGADVALMFDQVAVVAEADKALEAELESLSRRGRWRVPAKSFNFRRFRGIL